MIELTKYLVKNQIKCQIICLQNKIKTCVQTLSDDMK